MKALEVFHMKFQRQILDICWFDFVSNIDVLARRLLALVGMSLDILLGLRMTFLITWRSAGTLICLSVVLLVATGNDVLVDPALVGSI